jgi:hypothetical protein
MPVHHGKIKPGESLCTAEWWDLTRKLTLEQRGFAQMVLLFMHRHGWQDIPDDRTLANGLRLHIRVVRRLLPSLTAIPAHTIHQQLLRIGRWPEAIIEELSA